MKNVSIKSPGLTFHRTAIYYVFVSILLLAASMNGGIARADTYVSGPICTDTTWSKTGSPYTLIGDITIAAKTALTIKNGVTVNLNGFAINVEGVINATKTIFHMAVEDSKKGVSVINVKAGGVAKFNRITADGKDYIVVHAGGKVTISAPVKKVKKKPKERALQKADIH